MAVNPQWAVKQLDGAGYTKDTHLRVRAITDAAIDAADLIKADDTDIDIALDMLAKVMRNSPVYVEPDEGDGEWVQFRLGDFISGTRVRIKLGAYGPGIGQRFNGMMGYFSAARNGQALIKFDGESNDDFTSRHAPDLIEAYVER